ncbi:MAG: bifunctional isocitrate dehydrogenase kinase/phosphatase [Herpetosiphonaceae bacterium]|nr:bifunctional isocitrate dehydrogenase kinase/phosphatase [Herpetosiphonaceae bacterium]
MNEHLTDSRLANLAANAIYHTFDEYQQHFKLITRQVQRRFEQQDWPALQAGTATRLDLYTTLVTRIVAEISSMLGERLTNTIVWVSMKAVYSGLIADRDDWELAETFYNSVTRRIFVTVGVNPQLEFIATDFATPQTCASQPVYRTYPRAATTAELIATVLLDYPFGVRYQALERDMRRAADVIEAYLAELGIAATYERVEMVCAVFYRNKAAYLVGRIISQEQTTPLVLALLSTPDGISVDAVLLREAEVNILFSFTRSYFHVDIERPYDLVHFLASIMPEKRIAALYIAIGYHKHGKTEFYRDLLRHLSQTQDTFEIAPGERGMVMTVFTMPSYDVVFKIIKDWFSPPKDTTRQAVMDKYHLVFKHDRAGRLIDAHEFEYLKLDRQRFGEALLTELQRVAANSVVVEDDHVIIKHVYVERRVTPLDVYLREAEPAAAAAATLEFGNAIKDLAISNIFPGDMLLKNFGVTRNGRVVFYDYDELSLMTTCNFKHMPEPTSYDEEIAAEPWYAVGENDVFPEEFRYFLGLRTPLRDVFMRSHGEILTVDFWQQIQARLNAGEVIDIFPYDSSQRLSQLPG